MSVEVSVPDTVRSRRALAALLECSRVSIRRAKRRVIDSLDLRVGSGEMWAVIGPNGAGKSTLLEALVGTLPISCGEIFLAGRGLLSMTARERARKLALVGREMGYDLPLKVREVVELGRLPHVGDWSGLSARDESIVDEALAGTDCAEFAERFVGSLSDGERQRCQFARALAQEPRLLLMDEATAHLDLAHRHDALSRVREFVTKGASALVVVHDIELAVRYATHVAVLEQGKLVASGSPEQVLTTQLISEVFRVESEISQDDAGIWLRVFGPARRCATPRVADEATTGAAERRGGNADEDG